MTTLPLIFGAAAPDLLAAGEIPLPCGPDKAPLPTPWSSWRAPVSDAVWADRLAAYAHVPLTGWILPAAMIAVDIDTEAPDLVAAIIQAADRHLGSSPFRRTGRAPRTMIFYIASDGLPPGVMRGHPACQLLGYGRQVIVAGAHPIMGTPYTWDGPLPWQDTPPAVTHAQIRAFMTEVLRLAPLAADSHHPGSGLTSAFRQMVPIYGPALGLSMALAQVIEGSRHNSLLALVASAVGRGLSDEQIRDAAHRGMAAWTWPMTERGRELENALAAAHRLTPPPNLPGLIIKPPRGPSMPPLSRRKVTP
ncbi:MAG TPA: hypothetical protein VNQ78_18780 [Paracoccus sp. (in: a-proteobacteria)]|uniref:hypothetical protein n=1 Tax=Paracoccus sp. TaxID=267 RepID=UPI002B652807|nr:hypothetical protein [Paracoccus sp. (in: a-proteobacteria)]HWL58703.1 hypothetical protein [Paracoccus sp. (in: a-proteobacteria)]